MNPKHDITKAVLESIGLVADEKRIKQTIPIWWMNPRRKEKGGLRLTEQGFKCLRQADIKCYELKFEEPIIVTNELAIWIDQNIDCPFYLTHNRIWVFGEKMAVQLVLFSGNIAKFHRARKRFAEKDKNHLT
jgi:hypothetical protein